MTFDQIEFETELANKIQHAFVSVSDFITRMPGNTGSKSGLRIGDALGSLYAIRDGLTLGIKQGENAK